MTKNIIQKTIYILMVWAVFSSCADDENADTTPPGMVTVKEIIPTNGGAKIVYSLPADSDILFVKAVYTNSKGNEVFKVSSFYNDTIEVDGFNDTLPKQVNLYTVDRSDNHSSAVPVEVTPLESFIFLVQKSLEITPDLGGVKITWQNVAAKTVYVYVYYSDGNKETERILSSNNPDETIILRGMDSVYYDFSTLVEDFNGNKTDKTFEGRVQPKFEERITKNSWSLVQELSVNGNAWEGLTVNFWDNVVDTKDSPEDNSYFIINRDNNGGILNYPLDIVIDLNKQVIVNRFVVWQRAYWYSDAEKNGISTKYYYYQNENMRSFDIYTSNNKTDWQLMGKFDIGDPKDEDGNVPAEKIQEAIDGHEFVLENTSEPFRYLKFSITSSFGSETNVYGSEITLFGLDNVTK